MTTRAPSFTSDRSDDGDRVRIQPDTPWKQPDRDRNERGVSLPGIEPTRAPRENDNDPTPGEGEGREF
ncbi:MAG TPA: hypothetical protein VK420_17560 [Longimicrobium sp.]|nr:hypothetical protein [Longimicrobium sp.]